MYAFVKRMCQACPGCALANLTCSKSSELIYNFPIEAPSLVMHFNAYPAGTHAGFEGSERMLPHWLLWHDKFCMHGTHHKRICSHFCVRHHEHALKIWLLPHHHAR